MTEERSESAAGLSFKMGEALLRNGAEIFRVQETMERVARAYDIEEYDVYVLSNAIFANAVENGEKIDTKLKFVPGSTVHFGRIVGINQLSREIVAGKVSVEEAYARLHEIVSIPDTVPLVYQSRSWNNGVFIGSITGSETTAAAAGAVGVVRRDPMAMLPFCGYNMGDYFKHWIEMGEMLGDKAPKIFNVNWFRVDEDGHFIWPGFGDNLRVLEWILKRCDNEVDAVETAIGYVPKPEDINLEGLKDFDEEKLASILKVDNAKWAKEAAGVEEFYKKFGDKLPQELRDELNGLEERTKA